MREIIVEELLGPCVLVSGELIYLDQGNVTTPTIAAEFIDRFDNGESVEPFEFEFELPEEDCNWNFKD